jgi:hypothetical protein
MPKKLQEKSGIKGFITTHVFDTTSKRAIAIENEINRLLKRPLNVRSRQTYLELIADLKRLFTVREYAKQNLIVTTGRAVLAQRLANDTTYTGIINYGALGSGDTAPVNGDTTLETEVFRKTVASASDTDNIAFIDFFYSKSDTDGTYEEFGSFIDGTGSADTGQLFNRVLTGGWVKTSSESMTVACQFDID